jgi:hypothetical protein
MVSLAAWRRLPGYSEQSERRGTGSLRLGRAIPYRDVGIIVLTEPVPTSVVSEYAQLPSPGLVDELSKKAPVTLVGYGVQERIVGSGPPVWAGLRVRLMAPARLVSRSFTHSEEFVRVTASPGQGGAGLDRVVPGLTDRRPPGRLRPSRRVMSWGG